MAAFSPPRRRRPPSPSAGEGKYLKISGSSSRTTNNRSSQSARAEIFPLLLCAAFLLLCLSSSTPTTLATATQTASASTSSTQALLSAGASAFCRPFSLNLDPCDHKATCQLTVYHAVMKSAKALDGWQNTLVSDTCKAATTTNACFDECVQLGCMQRPLAYMAINQCAGAGSVTDCARDLCTTCGYDQTISQERRRCSMERRREMDVAQRQLFEDEQQTIYASTAADYAQSQMAAKMEVRPPHERAEVATTGTSIVQPEHHHTFREYVRPDELDSFVKHPVVDKWEISPSLKTSASAQEQLAHPHAVKPTTGPKVVHAQTAAKIQVPTAKANVAPRGSGVSSKPRFVARKSATRQQQQPQQHQPANHPPHNNNNNNLIPLPPVTASFSAPNHNAQHTNNNPHNFVNNNINNKQQQRARRPPPTVRRQQQPPSP